MKAYRVTVNLKLGLILFAGIIAVSSLWYTNDLVGRLKERETSIVQLWAKALEQVPKAAQQGAVNPYRDAFRTLESLFSESSPDDLRRFGITDEDLIRYREAVLWAQGMPPASELTFILDAFLEPNAFSIPAILVDSTGPLIWRNVPVEETSLRGLNGDDRERLLNRLNRIQSKMDAVHEPIPIEVTFPSVTGAPPFRLIQEMHYGESSLVRALRWFPYVQLAFVSLFVLVGYIGFSYLRRSERNNLWVGMAKEAAHQLGTPISSLMGWLAYLRDKTDSSSDVQGTYDEIEQDIIRLSRVASRFSDIGSLPKLEVLALAPVITSTADYMRSRLPRTGEKVTLEVDVPDDLYLPMNEELFEWVIENLLKNALDALESGSGRIDIRARREGGQVHVDVRDNGKGIDRKNSKNIFRPGYSTKKRGWGLGLSLAKRIIEDYHGGSLVLLQSRPGHGTVFRVDLPLAEG